jgi:hypothetical protein
MDDVTRIQTDALRRKTVEERIRIAESLRAFAWEVKRATLRRQHPALSDSEIMKRVRDSFGA